MIVHVYLKGWVGCLLFGNIEQAWTRHAILHPRETLPEIVAHEAHKYQSLPRSNFILTLFPTPNIYINIYIYTYVCVCMYVI
jgi:hypothetical protein